MALPTLSYTWLVENKVQNKSLSIPAVSRINLPKIKPVLFTTFEANYFAVGVTNITLLPIAVTLNALFIRAIYNHKSLQTNPNKLLVLLSIIDIINSLVSQLSFAIESFLFSFDLFYLTFDRAVSINGYAFTGISFLTVILISLERYIAILYPFIYEKYYRLKRVILYHLVTCFLFLCLTVLLLIGNLMEEFHLIMSILVAIGCIIILFCYYNIYQVSKKTLRRLSTISNIAVNEAKTHARNNRAAMVAALILLFLFISYSPFMIMSLWLSNNHDTRHELVMLILPWTQTLALLNGIFSPLIYYWRITEVRKKMISWSSDDSLSSY